MSITTDEAMDIVCGEKVASQEVSKHRWYTKRLIVFEPTPGNLVGFYYLAPATEEQEDQDRFEADPVPVFQVASREVVTRVYEPLDQG